MTTAALAQRTVLERFPAGHSRGSWPANEYAAAQCAQGTDARVVMDLGSDEFLVITDTASRCEAHMTDTETPEAIRYTADVVTLTPGGDALLIERESPIGIRTVGLAPRPRSSTRSGGVRGAGQRVGLGQGTSVSTAAV
ncbi:hypothetical protein [Streptomyces sp. NPDC056061]|uniref:hypothetical protein n=1 Tax=Streptomyces sp. NPDC056061 TaxID=3345700 RepID=UPI0035DBF54F